MSDPQPCPKCHCEYTYFVDHLLNCPECGNEWNPAEVVVDEAAAGFIVKDSNGTILHDGDTVVIVKSLPVKGAAHSIKPGTKVKNIRLVEGDHNIDCKVEGFGGMLLKSEFVKKA